MDSVMKKDFQNRIVNASRKELLLINYELMFLAIDEAISAIDNKDKAAYNRHIERAKKLLRELTDNLDLRYDIAKELLPLYVYVNGQLIKSGVRFKKESLENAKKVLKNLYIGWQSVEEEETAPIIENGQKVYAGLTYGKGQLNETVGDATSRGYSV